MEQRHKGLFSQSSLSLVWALCCQTPQPPHGKIMGGGGSVFWDWSHQDSPMVCS